MCYSPASFSRPNGLRPNQREDSTCTSGLPREACIKIHHNKIDRASLQGELPTALNLGTGDDLDVIDPRSLLLAFAGSLPLDSLIVIGLGDLGILNGVFLPLFSDRDLSDVGKMTLLPG